MFAECGGALLPFADRKGYALAYACELLAAVQSRNGTLQSENLRRGGFKNCLDLHDVMVVACIPILATDTARHRKGYSHCLAAD